MGAAVCKLIDAVLLLFFLIIAVTAPLIDAQTCLPIGFFPDFLVDLKRWYSREYGDYLVAEKPDFFVGVVWLQLLVQWPLALVNIYGILAGKSWLNITCLIYGVSVYSSMMAILADLIGSRKSSDKLLTVYFTFFFFGILAIMRGLMPPSGKTTTFIGKRPALARKKRA